MANRLEYNGKRIGSKKKAHVKVTLADDCKNGHNDFHITGTIYEKDKWGNWRDYCGGCCHEELHRFFPKLRPFIPLHGCDAEGAPSFSVGNGHYFLLKEHPHRKEVAMSFLRITEEEYNHLRSYADDKLHLNYLLYNMGIVARWKQEADAAIALLEELTGEKFEDNSAKRQIIPLTDEERSLVETRIAENYYTVENIRKREEEQREQAKQEELKRIDDDARIQKEKVEQERQIKQHLVNAGIPLDNIFYYEPSKSVTIRRSDYKLRYHITEEMYNDLLSRLDYGQLPAGIKFQLEKPRGM